ncbi:MAG: DinB family protein [Acidobacteriota bacterium]|nr:DinB family protein [Acidobacteriota bacterium]
MTRLLSFKTAIFALLLCGIASAQDKDPVTTVVRNMQQRQQKNILAAAQEMPAEKFGFKPTPQQMSFGHLILHITEANNFLCSQSGGVPAPKSEELKDDAPKDKLIGALKASFDFCETALAKVDDSKLNDRVKSFDGSEKSKAWALIVLTGSWADHYGAQSFYLRLSGLLPPTAEKQK